MNCYRIAGLSVAYTPHTDGTAAFLAPYRIEDPAQLTMQLSSAAIKAEAEHLPDADESILEAVALLRALSAHLPAYDRMTLHAAAVVRHDAAYAFVAPAGTGKTTHVQLWQKRCGDDAYILNDDRLFVHITPDGVTAYGGPWHGKEGIGQHASAPLRGIFVLTRSEQARVERLSPIEALPHILRAVVYPKTQEQRLTVLSLLESLAASVPFYRLCAPLSFAAVDIVLEELS